MTQIVQRFSQGRQSLTSTLVVLAATIGNPKSLKQTRSAVYLLFQNPTTRYRQLSRAIQVQTQHPQLTRSSGSSTWGFGVHSVVGRCQLRESHTSPEVLQPWSDNCYLFPRCLAGVSPMALPSCREVQKREESQKYRLVLEKSTTSPAQEAAKGLCSSCVQASDKQRPSARTRLEQGGQPLPSSQPPPPVGSL